MAVIPITPGQKNTLEPRVYDMGADELRIPANTAVVGVPGQTILKGKTADGPLVRQTGDNILLQGVSLDGGGFLRHGNLSGTVLDNIEVRNPAQDRPQTNGLSIIGGRNTVIKNSLFEKCPSPVWIGDTQDLTLESNELRFCAYGFKVFGDSTTNRNWTGRKNWVHDCPNDFMAFEWQGCVDGVILEDNFVEKIAVGPTAAHNDHSLLVSLPLDKAKNINVRRNTVLGVRYVNGVGHPMSFECGGENAVYSENYVAGGNVAFAVTDRVGACSVTINNNRVENMNTLWNKSSSTQVVTLTGMNGPATALSWDVNRGRPRRGGTFDGTKVTDGATPVPPDPTPIPPPVTKPVVRVLTPAGIDIKVEVQP